MNENLKTQSDPRNSGTQPANSDAPSATSISPAQERSISASQPQNSSAPLSRADHPIVAEATIETRLSDGSIMETTMVPKKKKHTGLIAAIVAVCVVVLAGIGAALWYFLYYSNPEKVAYDAISGLLEQKSLSTQGGFIGTLESPSGDFQVMVTIDSSAANSNLSSSISFMLMPLDANGNALSDPYRITLSNVIMSDGVFYIRTKDLVDTFDRFVEDTDLAEITDTPAAEFEMVSDILATIDDEWWQISVPDIIDLVSDDSSAGKAAKDFYACMVNLKNQDYTGELASAYSNNRFVTIKKTPADKDNIPNSDYTTYSMSFDYDKMAGFLNTLHRGSLSRSAYNCYNQYQRIMYGSDDYQISVDDEDDITAAQLQKILNFEAADIQMAVNPWNHQLYSIDVRSKNADSDAVFNMAFIYQDVEVSAPTSYRPITELFEDLIAVIRGSIEPQYNDYDYGDSYYPWEDDLDDDLEYDDWI